MRKRYMMIMVIVLCVCMSGVLVACNTKTVDQKVTEITSGVENGNASFGEELEQESERIETESEPTVAPEPTATPEPTVTPEPTATPEPTPTPEPTSTPIPTSTPTPTITPTPVIVATLIPEPTATPIPTITPTPFEMTIEHGMEKVYKLIEAYDQLTRVNRIDYAIGLQMDIENLTYHCDDYAPSTKDGLWLQHNRANYAVACHYYNNYVNNDTGWYNIYDWACEWDSSDSLYESIFPGVSLEDIFNPNHILMFEAGSIARFLQLCDRIVAEELFEANDVTISGFQSAYVVRLNCDGDNNIHAIYDDMGNLLNITTNGDAKYYCSNLGDGWK